MNNAYRSIFYILVFASMIFMNGCGDPAPYEYTESFLVQTLLVVGDPIQNVIVQRSQPLSDTLNFAKSLVRDADVRITGDGMEFILQTDASGEKGYYYEDKNYRIKPNTAYSLKIILPNGKIVTGQTFTPSLFTMGKKLPKLLPFPKDTVKMPAYDTIGWTKAPNTLFYIIGIRALDTVDYGKYLDPPTQELNRHVYKPHSEARSFRELSFYTWVPNDRWPLNWNGFKWFGMHEVNIYAPTEDYLKWFLQSFTQQMDPNLSTVKGASGVFGSASVIRDTVFLLKNQP